MYYIIIYQIMYIHSMPCSTLRGGGSNVIKCQFTLTFKSFRYSWNTIFYHIDIPKFWKMQMVFHLWGCIFLKFLPQTDVFLHKGPFGGADYAFCSWNAALFTKRFLWIQPCIWNLPCILQWHFSNDEMMNFETLYGFATHI